MRLLVSLEPSLNMCVRRGENSSVLLTLGGLLNSVLNVVGKLKKTCLSESIIVLIVGIKQIGT